ncbi:proteasome regulatory particle base subunit [Podila epigama]|nr:proteasome regulatory particle base subunit [Podila epigama]
MHALQKCAMRAMAQVFALLVLAHLALVAAAVSSPMPQDLKVTNLLRTVDLTKQVVREIVSAAVTNFGTEPVSEYYYPIDRSLSVHMAHITAENRKTKDRLEIIDDERYDNAEVHFYKVQLSPPLPVGEKMQITVTVAFSNVVHPFPPRIGQKDKQWFIYTGNAYALSAYPTKKQKSTVVTLNKEARLLDHPKGSPVEKTKNHIVLGPYSNIGPLENSLLKVHYELPGPILHMRKLLRDIEISHWGSNLAVEEHYNFVNRGAKLRGQFIREGARRFPTSGGGGNPVSAFIIEIPKLARDMYYRDEIGNISTSILFRRENSIEFSHRPRFPIYGGWNSTWYLGYNVPLDGFVRRVPDTDRYILKVPLITPMKDTTYDKVQVRIVLPEGAKHIKTDLPFEVVSHEYSTTKTYMDSAGRSTLTIEATNLVEEHGQDVLVEYEYSDTAYLIKPFAAAGMLMGIYIVSLVVSRLDMRIQGTKPSKSKLQ